MSGLLLKAQDQFELEVVYRASSGQMSRAEAALLLKVSDRTLKRYIRAFREKGVLGIRHGNSGRVPPNKIPKPQDP